MGLYLEWLSWFRQQKFGFHPNGNLLSLAFLIGSFGFLVLGDRIRMSLQHFLYPFITSFNCNLETFLSFDLIQDLGAPKWVKNLYFRINHDFNWKSFRSFSLHWSRDPIISACFISHKWSEQNWFFCCNSNSLKVFFGRKSLWRTGFLYT